ncbi:Hypothetical predicted protein [Argonauta hians]
MVSIQALRKDRNGLYLFGFIIFVYFIIMDIILYITLQKSALKENKTGSFSPFQPLTVKLLMTDPVDHYILSPFAEYFDEISQFSHVFYFITPNMISFTHVFIAVVAGKLIASESLYNRRIGALIYQFRCFLDAFDGVVYRSHVGAGHIYKSHRSSLGYLVDSVCDISGGTALCIGMAVYVCRYPPLKNHQDLLPWTKSVENGTGNIKKNVHVSCWTAFWRTFSFGMLLAMSAFSWDKTVERFSSILQVPISDAQDKVRQTDALHLTSTWCIMWMWRIVDGQALMQMVLIAIFLDKIWEFLTFMLYVGWAVLVGMLIISEIQIRFLREKVRI